MDTALTCTEQLSQSSQSAAAIVDDDDMPSRDLQCTTVFGFTESTLRSMVDISKPLVSVGTLGKKLEIRMLTEATSRRFFAFLDHHRLETASLLSNHVTDLMRALVGAFLDIRRAYMMRCVNFDTVKGNLRQRLSRTVIFSHQ